MALLRAPRHSNAATAVETPPASSARQKIAAKDGLGSGKGAEPWRMESKKRGKNKGNED